ncbi:MAG: alanine racemase [Betaproteobacteria bacterium]|nr:alanine racemase [Betaproteobacteria bacterium]
MRPLRAEISLSALRHNYALIKATAPRSKALAVVKADAYGHGLKRVVRALRDADGFATLETESAITLRDMGIEAPIVMLEGYFGADEINTYARHHLTAVLRDLEQVKQLADAKLPQALDVFLKFNTGMNRLGLQGPLMGFAINEAASHRNFGQVTLMSHFATADGPEGVADQLKRFLHIVKEAHPILAAKGYQQSLANSAALLRFPETQRDWVRPGLMLYGESPLPDRTAAMLGLKPVMTLRSEIIGIQTLQPGDSVGYGATYRAKKRMRIGAVACGYADGYPRHAAGDNERGTPVLVSGARTRTIGRISMDLMMVDLTELPHVHLGAPVTLWGNGLPAAEVAEAADTIAYELFCAMSPRVRMVEVE